MKIIFTLVVVLNVQVYSQHLSPQALSLRFFERLTGAPILLTDNRLAAMETSVKNGELNKAALIALDDSGFYNVVLRDWTSVMSNRSETSLTPLTDFEALVIGTTRDNLDARLLLTGDLRYEGDASLGLSPVSRSDNNHYADLEAARADLKSVLVKKSPQWGGIKDSAGLLTTRGWGQAHLIAGTNRRAIQYSFQEFLCTPIGVWRDTSVTDTHIRRDVTRVPGGNPSTFAGLCRGCHGPMDAMGGAFASFDFIDNTLVWLGQGIATKMNINGDAFPTGFISRDSSWINYATQNHNVAFGWRGPTEGIGARAFGSMLAGSKAFSQCMVKRVFKKICRRDPSEEELPVVTNLADRFESEGYMLRSLFANVAVQPHCINY